MQIISASALLVIDHHQLKAFPLLALCLQICWLHFVMCKFVELEAFPIVFVVQGGQKVKLSIILHIICVNYYHHMY